MEPGMDIFAAIDSTALKKRGTLRAWMADNYAAFEGRLATGKPDWAKLAGVFVAAGLLDARGNQPTAEATRKTWYRLKADRVKIPPATEPRPATGISPPLPPPTHPTRETTTNVQPSSGRPRTFSHSPVIKEGDAERLFGKRKDS